MYGVQRRKKRRRDRIHTYYTRTRYTIFGSATFSQGWTKIFCRPETEPRFHVFNPLFFLIIELYNKDQFDKYQLYNNAILQMMLCLTIITCVLKTFLFKLISFNFLAGDKFAVVINSAFALLFVKAII